MTERVRASLERAGVPERFDVALMTTKGNTVTAARELVDELTAHLVALGLYLPIFVLHDFDVMGLTILATFLKSSVRYTYKSGLRVIDATCPLVTKVHYEAIKYDRDGRWIILVGHAGHDEVIGTMGHALGRMQLVGTVQEAEQVQVPDPDRVAVITQTTLSIDDTREIIAVLKRRFPSAVFPPKDDICYATQNRQVAVKQMAGSIDLLLVIGSPNSSNSMRLVEVAQAAGVRAYLIDDISEIDPAWLKGVRTVGITAGASAPEHLVQEAVEFFRQNGAAKVEEWDGIREDVVFALPPEIQRDIPVGSKAARSLRVSAQP